jgi:hypothetical protein
MSLADGGHLTRRAEEFFRQALPRDQYGVDAATGEVDYDRVAALAKGISAEDDRCGLLRLFTQDDRRGSATLQTSVGAYFVVDMAHVAGLVATGLYPARLRLPTSRRRRRIKRCVVRAAASSWRGECRDRKEIELGALPGDVRWPADARSSPPKPSASKKRWNLRSRIISGKS